MVGDQFNVPGTSSVSLSFKIPKLHLVGLFFFSSNLSNDSSKPEGFSCDLGLLIRFAHFEVLDPLDWTILIKNQYARLGPRSATSGFWFTQMMHYCL